MGNQENLTKEELQSRVDYIFANSFNHTQHAYIDIAGDLIAGTLLSQIMYWFSLDKNKKSKIRIFKDGNYWLAKGREDWYEEIRISPKQYDTAVKKLKEKGLVETKLYKFNAVPTTHIRPVFTEINSKADEWKKKIELEIESGNDTDIPMSENSVLPNGENGNSQSVNMEVDKRANSLTENTNSDYINRDYSTENTDKYALKDVKKSSFKGDMYASVPEEHKDVPPKKQKRYIPPDYTEEQLRKHIKPVVENEVKQYIEDMDVKFPDDTTETFSDILCLFCRKYKLRFGENHYVMPDKTVKSAFRRYLEPPEEMDGTFDMESYEELIDLYFKTDFNKRGNYEGDIVLSFPHFMSDTIRGNLANRLWK